jgi:hypothetical protein
MLLTRAARIRWSLRGEKNEDLGRRRPNGRGLAGTTERRTARALPPERLRLRTRRRIGGLIGGPRASPSQKKHINQWADETNGRSERIRTSDPIVPNDVRYQAALHSDTAAYLGRQRGLIGA